MSLVEHTLEYLGAFLVNLRIGLIALLIGAVAGFVTARLRLSGGVVAGITNAVISMLRAFPVYVLMFVLLNFLASSFLVSLLGTAYAIEAVLILALSAYSSSAASDAFIDFINHSRSKRSAQAWLIVPNLFRIFTIIVIGSSVGAAIGVKEAVTYTLTLADSLYSRTDRILVITASMLFFALVLIVSKHGVQRLSSVIMKHQAGK